MAGYPNGRLEETPFFIESKSQKNNKPVYGKPLINNTTNQPY